MANPSVTYTFTNSTTADASEVNQNFSDLISSLTDGTKSLNIDAITAAGTATFNGNVALGNASGDTIAINGTVNSNVSLDGGTFVFNESGADKDFRIEGDTDANLFFCDAGNDRIGIGTATPSHKMEIYQSAPSANITGLYFNTNSSGGYSQKIAWYDNWSGGAGVRAGIYGYATVGANKGQLRFQTGNGGGSLVDVAVFDEKGQMAIGNTSPGATLSVETPSVVSNGFDALLLYNTGNSTPYGMQIVFSAASPDNNTQYYINCNDTGGARFIVYSDGDVQNHDNSYGGISDERLKQDIIDSTSQTEDIKALKIRKYRFKSDVEANPNAIHHIGVIAQELQQTSPGLVSYNEKDDTYSVQYSILYMKAVKALQETILEVEKLKTEVESLKAKLA